MWEGEPLAPTQLSRGTGDYNFVSVNIQNHLRNSFTKPNLPPLFHISIPITENYDYPQTIISIKMHHNIFVSSTGYHSLQITFIWETDKLRIERLSHKRMRVVKVALKPHTDQEVKKCRERTQQEVCQMSSMDYRRNKDGWDRFLHITDVNLVPGREKIRHSRYGWKLIMKYAREVLFNGMAFIRTSITSVNQFNS
jgi:hypothetical protein